MPRMDTKAQLKLLPEPKKTAWGQWIGTILIIGVLVGVGYFLVQNKAQAPAASTGGEVMNDSGAKAVQALHSFEWSFRIVGGNPKTGADLSEVTLTHDGVAKVVGTYEGHCSVLGSEGASAQPLVEGEVTAMLCYWAHKGDEVGVFLENGQYVVKHGTMKDGVGEVPGSRGGYEVLFTI